MIEFSPEECKKIIDISSKYPAYSTDGEYGEYTGVNYTNWKIENTENNKWIFDRLFSAFKEQTGIELISEPNMISLMKYTEGDCFERHFDTNRQGRIWNVGVQLNNDYEEGDFILYDPELNLGKNTGKIYVFESAREHEVKMIKKGIRWSLILFIWISHTTIIKKSII